MRPPAGDGFAICEVYQRSRDRTAQHTGVVDQSNYVDAVLPVLYHMHMGMAHALQSQVGTTCERWTSHLGPRERLDVHVVRAALRALICDLHHDGALVGV